MKRLLLFSFAGILAARASFIDPPNVDAVRENLLVENDDGERSLQFDAICDQLLVLFFDGCTCGTKIFQNYAQINCLDICKMCSTVDELCVDFQYQFRFTLVPPLEPVFAIVTEVQSGPGSSDSTLSIRSELDSEGEPESCSTRIDGRSCTSCQLSTICPDAIHDCRNLGIPEIVDSCNNTQLFELPTTNPFFTPVYDGFDDFSQCGAIGSFSPSPTPVFPPPTSSPSSTPSTQPSSAPVPAPTGIPPKKIIPADKMKDAMKLSAAEDRGGITRKLRDRVRGD